MTEEDVIRIIDERLAHHMKQSKYVFERPIQIMDGNDITLASDHGTRIGTSLSQKLAFLGADPVARQVGALRDMSVQPTPGVSSTDYSARAGVQDINSVLINLGLATW